MYTNRRFLSALTLGAALGLASMRQVSAEEDPLAGWRHGVVVHPVSTVPERHTIHTYYLTSPESPDGSKVIFYASHTATGEHGDLIVQDRVSGRESVIARDLDTEDAHRAALQQWISNGRRVAYHDVKNGRWSVHVVDLATGQDRVIANDRQLGFGRTVDDLVPLYGCHWNPGSHHDMEIANVVTGEIRTAVTMEQALAKYGDWIREQFHGQATSIFFPVISPDGQRVFFKLATPGPEGPNNNFRSTAASDREGMFVFQLADHQPLFLLKSWGHPAWFPDSDRILEVEHVYYDLSADARKVTIPDLPRMPGEHPSVSPDGKLIVRDGPLTAFGEKKAIWGVMVCDVRGGKYQLLARFDNSHGATSWRHNHPHPAFSPDGRRIYFNENSGPYTQLFVAERGR